MQSRIVICRPYTSPLVAFSVALVDANRQRTKLPRLSAPAPLNRPEVVELPINLQSSKVNSVALSLTAVTMSPVLLLPPSEQFLNRMSADAPIVMTLPLFVCAASMPKPSTDWLRYEVPPVTARALAEAWSMLM